MNLPACVLACPSTLALILRAKIVGDLPNSDYDAAWDALEAPDAYQPSDEVQTWVRENWNSPEFGFMGSANTGEISHDFPVSRPLARTWMPPFLDVFVSSGGNAAEAARHAGVSYRTPYQARERDKVFAEAWEWAERKVADAIRGEIYRRAVEGWEEPQFGMLAGKGAGEGEIGAVREFDSSLLIKMATARVPEYRTLVKEGAAQVSASASASASTSVTVTVPPEKVLDLQARQQRQLEKQAERGGAPAAGRN